VTYGRSFMSERAVGYLAVTGAAALWGTLGIFFHCLVSLHGLDPLEVAFFRASLSAVLLAVVLALRRPALLRVRVRDVPFFAVFGLLGVAALFVVYAIAVRLTTVATAAVLLYTAPAWVAIVAWPAFGERLTGLKLLALALALVGCALVSGAYDVAALRFHAAGILCGLAAGFAYGLYTLFSKLAVRRYSPWTAMLYALGSGALFLMPLQSLPRLVAVVRQPVTAMWLLGLALGPTVGAYLLLGVSLQRLPASVVSIAASSEPVFAALLAWAILGQVLAPLQVLGGIAVVASVLLLHSSPPQHAARGSQR
jgi:DME family drug/metabolite transporter